MVRVVAAAQHISEGCSIVLLHIRHVRSLRIRIGLVVACIGFHSAAAIVVRPRIVVGARDGALQILPRVFYFFALVSAST